MYTKTTQPGVSKHQLVAVYRQAVAQGVPVNEIDQAVAKLLERSATTTKHDSQADGQRQADLQRQLPLPVRVFAWVLPIGFLGVGLWLFGTAAWPVVQYAAASVSSADHNQLVAPIPREDVLDVVPTVISPAAIDPLPELVTALEPKILDQKLDYTNLNNWFEEPLPDVAVATGDEYYLDIPSLKIEKAMIKIGGTNLNQSLIQYPGTAEPGTYGAPVIFGHSVLRQFYQPDIKNPRRYLSIFSYLNTLKEGEEIIVTHRGVKYTYRVRSKKVVKPEDTYILAQHHDARLLQLVTCEPPGTYLARAVITAELQP